MRRVEFREQDPVNIRMATPPRYALLLGKRTLKDTTYHIDDGLTRSVEYRKGTDRQERIKDMLVRANLILGVQDESASKTGNNKFWIPPSARPVSYDIPIANNNPYAYQDSNLFHDAGHMLGSVSRFFPQHALRSCFAIDRAFSIVDLVERDEEHLYLTPGIELMINHRRGGGKLSEYVNRMSRSFGERFDPHVENFTSGFQHSLVNGELR